MPHIHHCRELNCCVFTACLNGVVELAFLVCSLSIKLVYWRYPRLMLPALFSAQLRIKDDHLLVVPSLIIIIEHVPHHHIVEHGFLKICA